MGAVRVAIAGVGSCASALVQGVAYYSAHDPEKTPGLMHARIGPYGVADIEFVAAFDVDARKVGRPLEEAIFAAPNRTAVFERDLTAGGLRRSSGVRVAMAPLLDGVAEHMLDHPADQSFRVAELPPVDLAATLRDAGAEVLVSYLPVGSERAARHVAEACLEARVALVNCIPVFLASDPVWAERFRAAGLPILGDDVKSQLGATIVHRALARLFADRGVELERTYQLNTGGNTDFLNMLERSRLESKKRSKTQSVQSQLDVPLDPDRIHVGPSDYVSWQGDNKLAFIRLEGRGFGGQPIELELRLSVQDSPNSAGVVIDAVRVAKLALDRGLAGPLEAASAWFMKSPPRQLRDEEARLALALFLAGDATGGDPSKGDLQA
ncbi:MAG: inositol-3-phosphate synthase [Deltaproteobacteria bacterium]|nr:inositol-3-phosphate synthase [Deltaproteobacteria bacterium]